MIKMILALVALSVVLGIGYKIFSGLDSTEKLQVIKTVTFWGIALIVAVGGLTALTILF